ncbi:Protein of unknown function [Lactobacillus pasteurii DSM 23907 = CRBIP 24.76]|uniref:Uncharacterized protein n=1 Tax=Lactobacillus pasteurii DSM 23907 = CRBIP 24.76 TaxID=1423790 RepID=I7LDA6_9LACO|nr:Protein of unknown function [Lactobacillus pasteurii DSM 23907 = CRBIP 24.76]
MDRKFSDHNDRIRTNQGISEETALICERGER